MTNTNAFGKLGRLAGRFFVAIALLVVAVVVGFGGTALFVYHQLDGARTVAKSSGSGRRAEAAKPKPDHGSDFRRVAAVPGSGSEYTYANNSNGQGSVPARRLQPPAINVPGALSASASSDVNRPVLDDPESRYIVDPSGRVVGIDGTVGARHEADVERARLAAAPQAVAVQTPEAEVRVASPVVVRRAMPVDEDSTVTEPAHGFNVSQYLATDRPVLRAQPVNPSETQPGARTTRVYRLSDDSRFVTAN